MSGRRTKDEGFRCSLQSTSPPVREIEELRSCARVVSEETAQRTRDHLGVLLLDTAHARAEVDCLDDDADTGWLEDSVDGVRDLLRQPLLNLQPPSIDLDDPRQLGQADNPSVRDIGDVRATEEWQQVVLTMTMFWCFSSNNASPTTSSTR